MESFDIVLCDNVVDHAEDPRRIVEEICRVLTPGGLLYFTVNVHHPFYHVAATLHAGWRALGLPFEDQAFRRPYGTPHLAPPLGPCSPACRFAVFRRATTSPARTREKRPARAPERWLKRLLLQRTPFTS